jgi:predicted nucleic acid-binding protein
MRTPATIDSSFWINAHRSNLLMYAMRSFEIYFVPQVAAEMSRIFPSGQEFWRSVDDGLLQPRTPSIEQVTEFGPGERAAMNLALENPEWLLLIDDHRPLRRAESLGIRATCTPALVVHWYGVGEISLQNAIEGLARLAALQTLSPELIRIATANLALASAERER